MSVQLDSQQLKTLHRRAMESVDWADDARRKGNRDAEASYLLEAFEFEREAANMLFFLIDVEPTRSVLYRSAASLGLRVGALLDSEQLIGRALGGNPPPEIAEELRDLYEQINFERHLELRGIKLQPGEFQLSLAGPNVGAGVAPSHDAYDRIMTMQRMMYRTAERQIGLAFREKGAPGLEIKSLYETFISVPRVASFALTVRLGSSGDLFGAQSRVIKEVISNLDLVQAGNLDKLNENIPNEAYFNNFVALAGQLAPDGKNITLVGLSTETEKVAITKSETEIRKVLSSFTYKSSDKSLQLSEEIEVVGVLSLVDGRKDYDRVVLHDESGISWSIKVPLGLMDDVIVPNWRKTVKVSGQILMGKVLEMKQITSME